MSRIILKLMIQLIPSDINRPIFRHFGGCAEYGLMEKF